MLEGPRWKWSLKKASQSCTLSHFVHLKVISGVTFSRFVNWTGSLQDALSSPALSSRDLWDLFGRQGGRWRLVTSPTHQMNFSLTVYLISDSVIASLSSGPKQTSEAEGLPAHRAEARAMTAHVRGLPGPRRGADPVSPAKEAHKVEG